MISELRDSRCPLCRRFFGEAGFSRLDQAEEWAVNDEGETGSGLFLIVRCHGCSQEVKIAWTFTPAVIGSSYGGWR